MNVCRQKGCIQGCLCKCVLAASGGWQMVRAESLSPVGPSSLFIPPSLQLCLQGRPASIKLHQNIPQLGTDLHHLLPAWN